jgi:bifunctional DNase/RNase
MARVVQDTSAEELKTRVADALELAIAAGAPMSVMDKLASARGFLEALTNVPQHALVPAVTDRAARALDAWERWRAQSRRRKAAA